ncbi:MAG: hypothetical protein WAL66_10965 [Nitrososphaeraceae archaeon]
MPYSHSIKLGKRIEYGGRFPEIGTNNNLIVEFRLSNGITYNKKVLASTTKNDSNV